MFKPGVACPEAIAPDGVRVEKVGGNAAITFFDNGKVLTSATHPDQVTNIATRQVGRHRISGQRRFHSARNGSAELRLSGTTAFVFFPGDVGPGDDATARSYVFTGNVTLIFDALGAVVACESSGTMEDVCAMIA